MFLGHTTRGALIYSGLAILLSTSSTCHAQEAEAGGKETRRSTNVRNHETYLQKEKKALSPASLEAAPTPARVNLKDGQLTVDANNSSLAQILQDVAHISGMSINGLHSGPRIFGLYGPGNSREVLAGLLEGSGYDFIMIGGSAEDVPHELVLMPRNNNAAPPASSDPRPSNQAYSEPSKQSLEQSPEQSEWEPSALGPGAIAPTPSQSSKDDDSTRAQHTLQRLQHMQQQQDAPQ